jgi:hypothetical protein
MSRELERAAENAVKARRRKLLMNTIEIALGELVAMEGIPGTREIVLRFARQLRWY